MKLPSADHVAWLEEAAVATEKSGQILVATRLRKIARALEAAEMLNTLNLKELDACLKVPQKGTH